MYIRVELNSDILIDCAAVISDKLEYSNVSPEECEAFKKTRQTCLNIINTYLTDNIYFSSYFLVKFVNYRI